MAVIWVAVIVVCIEPLAAHNPAFAQTKSPPGESVSVQDLDPKASLSKQQILVDIVELANARRESDSLGALALAHSGVNIENKDFGSDAREAMKRALELEAELQKVMPRARIDAAVRSYNELSFPTAKLRTPVNYQDAMKKASKRQGAIRALANMIERATTDNEKAEFRKFLSAVEAAPSSSANLIDSLLRAQSSDALTGTCASLVLSQFALSTAQAERMMQGLSKQRTTAGSDPIIQHLIDLATEFAQK